VNEMTKGKSPFYPGQPVPVELFVGRSSEISRIMTRGAAQVQAGKPMAFFTQGEYGIGKSSVAGYMQRLAEKQHDLHGIYATLGGCKSLNEVAAQVLEATLRSGAFHPDRTERIKNWLGKYVGDQAPLGLNLNFSALKSDAPGLSSPYSMLTFLAEARAKLETTGVKGIFLVLDEINGVASDSKFANFVKGLVDSNALSEKPLPLLLMLCGVEERRREMIHQHQPIDRIFDIVDIGALSESEMSEFFNKSFRSVNMRVSGDAMWILTHYSAGFPKIMHLVGDAAFWLDVDGKIDDSDAGDAVLAAAEEVGRRYVQQQVIKALRGESYLSTLDKIAGMGLATMSFQKAKVSELLTPKELGNLDNFLQRMKKLKVLRSGDVKGEYVFNSRMVRLYIGLRQRKKITDKKNTP
jgi:hypothetical protein